MRDFNKAFAFVMKNEGGYSNDASDAGGETKFGISKRSYPDIDIAHLTEEQATEIYERDFWAPYASFPDRIATKVFDLAVNMGHRQAVLILQRVLRCCGALNVKDDGILGPVTRSAVQVAHQDLLMVALRSEAAGVYRLLAAKNPSQQKFLNGWLKRSYL